MRAILRANPEFAKYIWLEFSLTRKILMPALAVFISVLVLISADTTYDGGETLKILGAVGFVCLGLLWGIKSAADSVLDEHNDKTWDWTRLSGTEPWRLAIGKLFGSTLYNWYCALVCSVIYILGSVITSDLQGVPSFMLYIILSMVTTHAFVMILALMIIRRTDSRQKVKSVPVIIGGLLAAGATSNIGTMFLSQNLFTGTDSESFKLLEYEWYGIGMSYWGLGIMTSVFYAVWAILGLYRCLRAELRFSDLPIWWVAFIITAHIFHSGISMKMAEWAGEASNFDMLGPMLTNGISTWMVLYLLYGLAFLESKDLMHWRAVLAEWGRKDWPALFRILPLWLITLPFFALFGLLFVMSLRSNELIGLIPELEEAMKGELMLSYLLGAYSAILGLVMRDMIVIQFLGISRYPKRTSVGVIVYLILAYGVFPWLMPHEILRALFVPMPTAGPFVMGIAPWVPVVVAAVLYRMKWVKLNAALAT